MEERRNAIIALLNKENSLSIAQLKEAFPDVSEMTLRNDIKALDKEHRLIRVYGGIRSIEFVVGGDGMFEIRRDTNADAKSAIASKAAGIIRENTTIYLDSGTTTAALASAIPDQRLIIFTCGVYSLFELARLERVTTIVPGGSLNRFNMCLHGSRAIREVRKLRFDQVFVGVTAYNKESGFSCGSDEEAELKRICMEQAEQRVVLMDSSKIGKAATFSVGDLEDIDTVITDGKAPADFLERCQDAGVEVL